MSADPVARVLLAGILYRASLRAFAGELASHGMSPPTAAEKMVLHRAVEERAWALPDEDAVSVRGRDVDEGVDDLPRLAEEAARLAREAAATRRKAQAP